MKAFEWLKICLFLLLFTSSNAVPSPDENVVDINKDNFQSLVESSDKLWAVKYYIPWCGYCIKFAPTFEALAKSTKGWDFLVYGQISCPYNTDLCAAHNSSKAPEVKLLIPTSGKVELKPLMTGMSPSDSMEILLNNLLDQLDIIQQSSSDTSKKLPLLRQVSDFADMQSSTEGNIFLIIDSDKDKSRAAELVILDLFKYHNKFRIFRTSVKNAEENMNVFQPGVYQFSQGGSFVQIPSKLSRIGMRDAILAAVGDQAWNYSVSVDVNMTSDKPQVNDKTYVYRKAHGLHMADLITGLRYSLWTEVPMVSKMSEEAQSALMKYLDVLIRYHPADLQVIKFLKLLHDWMENHISPITSKEWTRALESLETVDAYIPSNTTWKGCKGSEDYLRGYPCSLWMTFHTLTVRAYLDPKNKVPGGNINKSGMDVLMAIRGFIEHFFSCSECSQNFVYYSRSWLSEAHQDWPPKRAVLDLWRRHNSVNSRLHLQPQTEDPIHPKIQFPALEDCPECRSYSTKQSIFTSNPTDWDEEGVFKFLVEYYASSKVASCAEKGKTLYSSKWSACSKTCGTGLSLRLANDNKDCVLRMETRLCSYRPCSLRFPDWSRSPWHRARCPLAGHTYQVNEPTEVRFHNCTAKVDPKRRVCGLCPATVSSRRPVCCRPSISRTEYLEFKCRNSVDDSPEVDFDGVWLNKRNRRDVMDESARVPVEMVYLCHCSEKNCKDT